MSFTLSDEQVMFKDTVSRFLKDNAPFENRQTIVEGPLGYDESHWQGLAELGIFGLPFSESSGGLGGSALDTMVVMREVGKALLTVPVVPTLLLGGCVLDRAGNESQKVLLTDVIEGRAKISFAYAERTAGYTLSNVLTVGRIADGEIVIDGKKTAVLHGGSADYLVVLVRTSSQSGDQQGLSMVFVPSKTSGVSITTYPLHDGHRAADVQLDNVRLSATSVIGQVDNAFELAEETLDYAAAAVCAEAVGIMWAIHDMTLEYLKTRTQFGQTLGSFQALQHRMVDMYMKCEMAESMAFEAANGIAQSDKTVRKAAVSAAKCLIGDYGRVVGQEGIQLHGGIGMTLDFPIGHYFKRLTVIDRLFGDSAWHNARYGSVMAGMVGG